jgi:LssY-like putative type I secretion system component LssY
MNLLRFLRWGIAAWSILGAGCAGFQPQPLDKAGFEQRAQSSTDGRVTVSVAALTEKEARDALGVDVGGAGIQPVWVKVANQEAVGFTIPPIIIDPEYFSPMEAAWQAHGWFSGATNARIDAHFRALRLPGWVGPGETVSGFVFTNLDEGFKYVSVELTGSGVQQVRRFALLANVPDLDADYLKLMAERQRSRVQDMDEPAFRAWVEKLPCCVLGGDRKTPGDPLNVVVVGERSAVFLALARRGWNGTASTTVGSALHIAESSIFGTRYRYGPVSPLYVFGRRQDVSFQKARSSVNERTHMRLWEAPVKVNGTTVWVGQVSRDIGVRLTTRTITTHKIDPEVDETRWYLNQDMQYSHSLGRHAYAKGVGAATIASPRANYTGDPYWTDGLRLVMWLSADPVSYHQVEAVQWEAVPVR